VSDLTIQPQDLGIGRLFERVREAVIVADAKTQRIVLWISAATKYICLLDLRSAKAARRGFGP
jgi:hypothetical protein